jgi:hypothetical protein
VAKGFNREQREQRERAGAGLSPNVGRRKIEPRKTRKARTHSADLSLRPKGRRTLTPAALTRDNVGSFLFFSAFSFFQA